MSFRIDYFLLGKVTALSFLLLLLSDASVFCHCLYHRCGLHDGLKKAIWKESTKSSLFFLVE